MEQRTITGQYRLDPNADRFFGARTVHFRQIENAVLGRFGRRGTLRGSMDARVLRANWKNDDSIGWLVLTFDEKFSGFQGEYGTDETAPIGTISAKRDVRKRSS
jgi:hypothetical protein